MAPLLPLLCLQRPYTCARLAHCCALPAASLDVRYSCTQSWRLVQSELAQILCHQIYELGQVRLLKRIIAGKKNAAYQNPHVSRKLVIGIKPRDS